MSSVADVLDFKGRDIWSIDATATIFEATRFMEEKGVGALPVSEGSEALAGVISERDCARATILKGMSAQDTRISDIMTRQVISVEESTIIDRCMYLMSHHKIRHLPVTAGAELRGIISGSDIMNYRVREQSETIEALESIMHDEKGGEG